MTAARLPNTGARRPRLLHMTGLNRLAQPMWSTSGRHRSDAEASALVVRLWPTHQFVILYGRIARYLARSEGHRRCAQCMEAG
jgi:hypothetical protein